MAFDYDNYSGEISGGRVALDLADYDGMPDGMCIDAQKNCGSLFSAEGP
jgi:sugar lactone lactonase YvrE